MVDVGEARVFFKVLLGDFNVNLRLPDKFVRSFIGKEKWAKLNLSSSILGKQWTVEIREDSCGFHLSGNRWRDFVQDHDLRFGYFLVFKYLRDMDFLVEPFDHSCCIKLYPPVQEDNTTTDHHVQHSKFSVGKKNSSQETTDDDKLKKKNVDKNLKVKNKPQFKVTMQPSYIDNRFMNFPSSFRDANSLSAINEAILTNTNGHWPVKICHTSRKNGDIKSVFSAGCSVFVRENNLKKGDVCIFDLLSRDGNRANFFVTKEVDFSRKENNSNVMGRNISQKVGNSKETTTDKPKMMMKKTKSVEKNLKVKNKPQFKISIQPSYICKRLMPFPCSFRDANNLSSINEAILTNTNGHWPVKFCHTSRKNGNITSVFSAGWSAFLRENNLKEGDVYNFELLSKDENRSNFFVTKEMDLSKKEDNSIVPRRNISRKVGKSRETTNDKLKMMKKKSVEKKLKVKKKPQFKISMTPTYIYKNFMYFPRSFRDANNLSTINEVILINTNGRWPVKFCHTSRKNGDITSVFTVGWIVFLRENNLKEGDVCIFELSSKDENRANFIVTKEVDISRKEDHSNVPGRSKSRKVRNSRETTTDKPKMMMTTKKKMKSVEKNLKVKKKPQFKISITPTHIYKGLMSFPIFFRDANNLSSIKEAILSNTNGHWPVKFCHTSRKKGIISSAFTAGWVAFISENNLKLGDVCIFELSSKDENRANFFVTNEVDLSRKEDSSNVLGRNLSRKVGNSRETTTDKLKMIKKKKCVEKKLKVKKKPQFKSSMTPTYIYKNFVYFPSSFRDANNLSTINEAILTNTNGRWPVKICHTPQKGKIHSLFSAGWAAFIRENNLKLGDVCIFELSSKDDNRANFFVTKTEVSIR